MTTSILIPRSSEPEIRVEKLRRDCPVGVGALPAIDALRQELALWDFPGAWHVEIGLSALADPMRSAIARLLPTNLCTWLDRNLPNLGYALRDAESRGAYWAILQCVREESQQARLLTLLGLPVNEERILERLGALAEMAARPNPFKEDRT